LKQKKINTAKGDLLDNKKLNLGVSDFYLSVTLKNHDGESLMILKKRLKVLGSNRGMSTRVVKKIIY